MGSQSNDLSFLRALAQREGVEPTDEDLEAVLAFLERILPVLRELQEQLPPETPA